MLLCPTENVAPEEAHPHLSALLIWDFLTSPRHQKLHWSCRTFTQLIPIFSVEETLTVLVQECVSWPIKADYLMTGETRTAFQTEGEYTAVSMRKLMGFLSTEACKPVLVVTRNKMISLKRSIIFTLNPSSGWKPDSGWARCFHPPQGAKNNLKIGTLTSWFK